MCVSECDLYNEDVLAHREGWRGGELSYIEKERGIFRCNEPEQMKKEVVII